MSDAASLHERNAADEPSDWMDVPLSFRPARLAAYLAKTDRVDVSPVAQKVLEQIAEGQLAEATRLLDELDKALERTQQDKDAKANKPPSLLIHARGLAALPASFPPGLRCAIARGIAQGRVDLAKNALTRHRWLRPLDGPVTVATLRRYARATADALVPKDTSPEVAGWVKAAGVLGIAALVGLWLMVHANHAGVLRSPENAPHWTEPLGASVIDGALYTANYLEARGDFDTEPELENAAMMLSTGLQQQPIQCALLRGEVRAVRDAAYRARNLSANLGPIRYLQQARDQLCPESGEGP